MPCPVEVEEAITMVKDKKDKGKKGAGLMGTDTRKPKHSLDTNRPSKGVPNQRDAATELQSKDLPSTRIQPDRRWFGNTRVVGQKQLEQFRTEMATKVNDSYTVLLREKKLPLQLLEDPEKKLKGKQVLEWDGCCAEACRALLRRHLSFGTSLSSPQVRSNLLATQPFKDTFGPNTRRKRPKLSVDNIAELSMQADERDEKWVSLGPHNIGSVVLLSGTAWAIREGPIQTYLGRAVQGAGLFRCHHSAVGAGLPALTSDRSARRSPRGCGLMGAHSNRNTAH
eukprot:1149583-Pelagomonas_calceolata.AAC.3